MLQTKFVEKIKTNILCSITFFLFRKSCRLWDNMEKYCKAVLATDGTRRMRIAYWIPKTTNTHLEYIILIAFPLQQWMHGSASLLRYTYIACLVCSVKRNFCKCSWTFFLYFLLCVCLVSCYNDIFFAVSQPMATWYTYINTSKELSYYKFQMYIRF